MKLAEYELGEDVGIVPECEPPGQYVLVPGAHSMHGGVQQEVGTDRFVDDLVARMPNGTIYSRGGVAGELVGDPGRRAFSPMSIERMRLAIDRHLKLGRWVTTKGTHELSFVACDRDHGRLAAAGFSDAAPEIKQLVSHPVYGAGFALCEPGLHNGIYYDRPPELADLSPETDTEVIRHTLDDLVIDFPFKDEPDRQNYFGLLLTPLLQPALDEGNRPMHLIGSPLERTGKSKLAEEVFGGIIAGDKTPALRLTDNDDEMDKRILALLIRGRTMVHLDNLKGYIDSPVIASLLTARTYQGRVLGISQMAEPDNNLTVVGTGNNVGCTGEIAKRIIPIMLQPKTDAPEERTDFKHPDLWGYVRQHRRLVLSCLLGMVQNWLSAGQPSGSCPMGGFDRWAEVIGGIMAHHGYTKWLSNAKDWRNAANPVKSDLEALVEEWHKEHGTIEAPVGGSASASVTDLVDIANRIEVFEDVLQGRRDKGAMTAFGMKVLSRSLNMPVKGFVIQRMGQSRPALYYLRKAQ